MLYGSRARGESRRGSDYDIAVVSEAFTGTTWLERIGLLLELADELREVEPVGFTPTEFESFQRSLTWDILHEGQALAGESYFQAQRARFQTLLDSGALRRIPGGWRYDRDRIAAQR